MTEPLQPPTFPPPASAPPAFPPPVFVPPPSVPTRKGPLLWILAAVSAALLIGTGALGYLWSSENTSSRSELDTKDSQIDDLEGRVDDLETSNERRQNDIDDLKADLAANQALVEDLTACPATVQTYLDVPQGNESALSAAIDEMLATCHLVE